LNTSIRPIAHGTSIRLSAKAERRLDFLAAQTGRTKAFYLRQMIESGLGDLEDYHLAADVLEAGP
jgi:RHH-type rel operon transcriptional repressor/antitoxin RelB